MVPHVARKCSGKKALVRWCFGRFTFGIIGGISCERRPVPRLIPARREVSRRAVATVVVLSNWQKRAPRLAGRPQRRQSGGTWRRRLNTTTTTLKDSLNDLWRTWRRFLSPQQNTFFFKKAQQKSRFFERCARLFFNFCPCWLPKKSKMVDKRVPTYRRYSPYRRQQYSADEKKVTTKSFFAIRLFLEWSSASCSDILKAALLRFAFFTVLQAPNEF